uniref:HTH tetR-type domain-containing protein n=1 Tax=Phenylobacterium glaciei TaxID=2803784 RepID=A0A974P196_9CAUL|nr:hypothetical protein JKL49_20340 [Phenylobacterium glaciei]
MALDQFSRLGFERASMSGIAQAAGSARRRCTITSTTRISCGAQPCWSCRRRSPRRRGFWPRRGRCAPRATAYGHAVLHRHVLAPSRAGPDRGAGGHGRR